VSAAATGATAIEVNWESVSSATHYSVLRRQPDTEVAYSTIAINVTATDYSDSTVATDTIYEYRLFAHNMNGTSPASQAASVTAGQSNLTAYRPQSIQNSASPIDAPIYAPFIKKPVLEQHETSNALGPGIRVNLDDDNNNGMADRLEHGYEIPLENDLIEVRVDRIPGQGDMALDAGGSLSLFFDHDKETPIPFDPVTFNTEPLPFVNDTITVFVEWIDSGHGTDTLALVDVASSTNQDVVRFHTFRSLVVVFGGRSQNPEDTDGDGSIGDPVGNSTTNREGIFDLAQFHYDTGWDVMAFNSTNGNINAVISVAEQEIKNAYDFRLLDPFQGGAGFAILGYSWGGGATHDLIESLFDDGYFPFFAVYLDAVTHGGLFAQDDWPEETFYLLNIYQTLPFQLGGAAIINPEEMSPFSDLEEINVTTDPGWNANLDHFLIDDNPQVQQLIATRLNQLLLR
jgi:hypothetical protein